MAPFAFKLRRRIQSPLDAYYPPEYNGVNEEFAMWDTAYQDFKEDELTSKTQVDGPKAIRGCEMHERYGWGLTQHAAKPSSGILSAILSLFTGKRGS